MRGFAVLALAVLALAACASLQAGTQPQTSLRISFWDGGAPTSVPDAVWTLRCNPARGSLARPARACTRLALDGVKLFAPVRPDTVCTQLYGGPQRARIVGTVRGKRVWTTVTRTNGCEIARWQRLSPWLLPPGGVT
ncbi:MAG TPA: SSI family serine proteinase inhibitor [Gaiellaceae bacterium]|nr:SSI family serine proteinase inhibitor [Gaiellaceae bacterium]